MIVDYISKTIGIPSKKLFAITILNSSILGWYMFFANVNLQIVFESIKNDQSWIYIGSSLFYFFGVLSGVVGAIFHGKINNRKFLLVWITYSILINGFLLFFKGELSLIILGSLLGVSLGLGFPYCLSLFASNTEIKNRGRVSGLILLETFFMASIAIIVNDIANLGLIGTILLQILLRATGYFALITDDCKIRQKLDNIRIRSWFEIFSYRRYVLYFVPWLVFIIAVVLTDHLLWPTLPLDSSYDIIFQIGDPLHYLATAICAVISGIIADRYGRKPSIILGLAIFGYSYALIGSMVTPISVFIHLMTIGIAFGFVWVIYIAIPGDLSEKGIFSNSKERFYALICLLPLAIYGGLGAVPRAFGLTVQPNILSPLLSLILFLSVIPIWKAKDTAKQVADERTRKKHIEKIGELLQEEDDEKTY